MLDRIGKGDRISLAGAIVLFIGLFSPWYGIKTDLGGGIADQFLQSVSADAFDAMKLIDILLLLAAVGAGALIVLVALGKLDESFHRFVEVIGGAAVVLILFRLIVKPDGGLDGVASLTLKWGIFLSLIGAAAIAAGQFLSRTGKL